MTDEIAERAKAILFRSRNLALEIEAAIRDAVISEAGNIERFHQRREELTTVNQQFLFFYATSLVVLFLSSAEKWTEEKINRVIDSVAEGLVQILSFQGASAHDASAQVGVNAERLRQSFDTLRTNLRRLESLQDSEESDKAAFTLILMYLTQVYPACSVILSEGNVSLLGTLQRRFWHASMAANRPASDKP